MDPDLRILVVDDNEGCRELYALWLGPDHDVETAADGQEALAAVDDRVDIVFLDRQMPGPSGTEVARAIDDSDQDPYVVMVSSMEIDFDLVELPVDGYLQKPTSEEEILEVVDQYRSQQAYRDALDEFFSLTAKLGTIEARHSDAELEDCDAYATLEERVAQKRREVDEALATARADWTATFKRCMDDASRVDAQVDTPNGFG